jgi:hypothetical protein
MISTAAAAAPAAATAPILQLQPPAISLVNLPQTAAATVSTTAAVPALTLGNLSIRPNQSNQDLINGALPNIQ